MIFTDLEKEQLYKEYHKKVIGYLNMKVNDYQLAEDIASDVFLKVFEKLDSFDDSKASISTWIYTIARNTLTDYFRTRKVFEEVSEEIPEESCIEEDICNNEMLEVLANALKKLEERERDIIVMRFYSGITLKEIAAKMNISYAYVKILQNKALDALRVYLGE